MLGTLNDFSACTREFLEQLRASLDDDDDEEISQRLARGEKIPQLTRFERFCVPRGNVKQPVGSSRIVCTAKSDPHVNLLGILMSVTKNLTLMELDAPKTQAPENAARVSRSPKIAKYQYLIRQR